ncbi:TetR/AcrR family transcriptional regulator [Amycolatopsis albispora]|uniref:TetR family transcriptional regulator n=1 Tax=Amycolatopsis albispora TaxID=1804986 RepID=A0A344L540_9PSEU|nr:TetR/AcrR family transcriptional regulator [Amycolatopsis albispora]AXB43164.1 TetR family transcriptional regulator [Amycolatopsis albispora]
MTGRQRRRRDATATRQALLDAAEQLFAERGFDRTTVREIARQAEANQALLFRYFGSKEALFEAVVARRGRQRLAKGAPETLVEDTLRGILVPESTAHHSLETLLRSTGNDNAAAAIRREVGEEYSHALAALTEADNADLRADLVLAWILGIGLLRHIAQKDPLADADPDEVVDLVLGAVRTLLERSG